jgi:predicted enzyme related to lactoylglutathione lyase
MLRIRLAEPGHGAEHANGLPPQFDPARHAAQYGADIARDLLDSLLPDRARTIKFRPEIGAEHPVWSEYGLAWLDDPDLQLSEQLQIDLGAWESTEDWASRKPKLNAQGEALLARVRAELPDRYELVDDWRRPPAYAPAMADLRVLISAKDYEETLAFYGELLQLPIAESWDDPDGRGTLFGAASGFIEVFEANEHHPAHAVEGVRLAIEVADAQTIHDRVAARGVAITEAIDDRPWKHRSFTIDDPNGLALTFFNVID